MSERRRGKNTGRESRRPAVRGGSAAAAAFLVMAATFTAGVFFIIRSGGNKYGNDYYSVRLPRGWTAEAQVTDYGTHNVWLKSPDGKCAALVSVEESREPGERGRLAYRLSTGFVGNHSRFKSEKIVLTDDGELPFYRVTFEDELTIPEQYAGAEPWPDRIYYLYVTEEERLLCVEVRDYDRREQVEEIVRSMRLKGGRSAARTGKGSGKSVYGNEFFSLMLPEGWTAEAGEMQAGTAGTGESETGETQAGPAGTGESETGETQAGPVGTGEAQGRLAAGDRQTVRINAPDGRCVAQIWTGTAHRPQGVGALAYWLPEDFLGERDSFVSERFVLTEHRVPLYRIVIERGISPILLYEGAEPYPDELYYMYIDDSDFFLCVEGKDEELWDEVEEIVKTLKLVGGGGV